MLFSFGQSSDPNAAQTERELSFLHSVEFSDSFTCGKILEENPTLNVDVIDALGRTALRLAVRNENGELVEMLLERCSNDNILQAALQAISENHTVIAELILQHPSYLRICKKRKRLGDMDGFYKTEAESQFSADITPLNLAAQKNNFVIVQLLLQRGETIQKPHRFDCVCVECENRVMYDQLRMAYFRLNAYRGLASEAYVALSSEDPFLTALKLAKELRKLSVGEVHFRKEYSDLADQLSCFMVKLLDRVWTQQELETVLNKKGSDPDDEKYAYLARLKLALANQEKRFVAHPSVQQYLVRIWYSGLMKFDTYSLIKRALGFIGLSLAYPFIVIAYLCKPEWKWSYLAKQPKMKFLGHTLSLLVFLTMVIVFSSVSMDRVSSEISLKNKYSDCPECPFNLHKPYTEYRERMGNQTVPFGEDFPLRPRSPTISECFMSVWVVGMVVLEAQKIWTTGAWEHFKNLYNLVDFFLLQAYIAALTLFNLIEYKTTSALDHLKGQNVTSLLLDSHQSFVCYYWLNTDRQVWQAGDPIHLAESMFALANIVSFSRIFYLLPAIETLGPLQISLRRMINDIIKFLLFAATGLLGFIVSLRNVYWWYSSELSKELGDRQPPMNLTNAAYSFLDPRKQFSTVFWWIYGRGPMEALSIPEKYKNSQLTENAGTFLAAMYHIVLIVVFVNLLIAMMARSFEKIVGDVDAEWKYSRSRLYMEYISEDCALPVPFNLFQPVRDVILELAACIRQLRKDDALTDPSTSPESSTRRYSTSTFEVPESGFPTPKSSRGVPSPRRCLKMLPDEMAPSTYKETIQTIVRRYVLDAQRDEELNKSKLEDAKFDLSQTKHELIHFMEERDRKVNHTTICLQAVASEISTLVPVPPTSPRRIAEDRKHPGSSLAGVKMTKPRSGPTEAGDAAQPGRTPAGAASPESELTDFKPPESEPISFGREPCESAMTRGKESASGKTSAEREKRPESEAPGVTASVYGKSSVKPGKSSSGAANVKSPKIKKVSIKGEHPESAKTQVKAPDSEKVSVEKKRSASEEISVKDPGSEKTPSKAEKSKESDGKTDRIKEISTEEEKHKPDVILFEIPQSGVFVEKEKPKSLVAAVESSDSEKISVERVHPKPEAAQVHFSDSEKISVERVKPESEAAQDQFSDSEKISVERVHPKPEAAQVHFSDSEKIFVERVKPEPEAAQDQFSDSEKISVERVQPESEVAQLESSDFEKISVERVQPESETAQTESLDSAEKFSKSK